MNAFDADVDNAWKQGTVDLDSKKAKEAQKKLAEKEKLKEKGFGKPEEHPKLIQASIDQLEQNKAKYEKKIKFDYPNAIKLYKKAIDKLDEAKKAFNAKQYTKAAEHCKTGTRAMTEAIPFFNEKTN
jgi:tetratricopeptide (TPR) repeat protein